jgi:hypothetical protein
MTSDLAAHPAYVAWRAVEPRAPRLVGVEVLERARARAGVFRLRGAAPGGGDVVAKQRPPGDLDDERRLYERVLPALAVPTAAWLGFLEIYEQEAWLFLEDLGEEWYQPDDAAHRAMAVRWVAGLHAGDRPATDWLPEAGPFHFRRVLDEADAGLVAAMPDPRLSDEGRAVLDGIRRQLARAAADWGDVELACGEMPSTLAHGDFVPKNVRVRVRRGAPELVAFDWETAAIGPPAVDIALLPGGREGRRAYLSAVAEAWPGVRAEHVDGMHAVGLLFRLLHEVLWAGQRLHHEFIDRAVRGMAHYERALDRVLCDAGWRPHRAARV